MNYKLLRCLLTLELYCGVNQLLCPVETSAARGNTSHSEISFFFSMNFYQNILSFHLTVVGMKIIDF